MTVMAKWRRLEENLAMQNERESDGERERGRVRIREREKERGKGRDEVKDYGNNP